MHAPNGPMASTLDLGKNCPFEKSLILALTLFETVAEAELLRAIATPYLGR